MADEVRLWRIEERDILSELRRSPLDLEARIQSWLECDISILAPDLLVIGREVATDFGGFIDLLCVDRAGDLVVIELKRDKTPRDIIAQTLDYGSWVAHLSHERVTGLAEAHLGQGRFEEAYQARFEAEVPETLNQNHRLMIVASEIDAGSERIIRYLSETYGVNINVATFQYFREQSGPEYLARVFLIEPGQLEIPGGRYGSKRRPNLTYAQLEALADEQGVLELYRRAVSGLERHLQKHTTMSSVGFSALLDGSRKTMVSLLPQESNSSDGLRFQVYFQRLCTLLNVSEDEGLALLPSRRDPWTYYPSAGPDMAGFQGFLANAADVDRLLAALADARLGFAN